MFGLRRYSLRKSRKILQSNKVAYRKKGHKLTPQKRQEFEGNLKRLEDAIHSRDREAAESIAKQVETFNSENFKKGWFEYTLEVLGALIFALVIATLVRQIWFELYEIPTGSMRPTFKEQDHLTVSKLPFGINVPLRTEHFYFDPNLVQRTSIVIFSGDQIPIINTDTTYFWLFPYKKRYIKRCIGKPLDSIYFYGGKIYCVDKDGNLVKEFLDASWMKGLEYIPFLSFEGRLTTPAHNTVMFNQMNLGIGRIQFMRTGEMLGEIFNGKEWIKDQPTMQPHDTPSTYMDFFGMRNFAMARLLTRKQLEDLKIDQKGLDNAELYLELRHNPNLSMPSPRLVSDRRGYGIALTPFVSVIPLEKEQLKLIMDSMYTARFVVKNGYASRYSVEEPRHSLGQPSFKEVPDGTYEFYFGKAYRIGWGGITYELEKNHPLYSKSPENIQKLYNLGIEMDTSFSPHQNQFLFPSRYAYFREGDLYLLGSPILKKGDKALEEFNRRESSREKEATEQRPYMAFKDHGPPLKQDGTPNINIIRSFGLKIPEKNYLVLGDNHAMSADSRVFGFVPQQNLQGAPSLIIWPPGERLGFPKQKPYQVINIPRLIVWTIALLALVIWYLVHRWRVKQPIAVEG